MNNDLEQFSEERLKELVNDKRICVTSEVRQLARIALSVKQVKPVACKFGKNNGDGTYTPTYDYWPLPSFIKPHKDWPVTLFYDAPQPAHTEQSEMLKQAHSLRDSIGEIRQRIDASGGYDFAALRNEQVNSPAVPDGWVAIPKDMLADYRDVKNGELQTYKASFGSHCDIPRSRWQRDLADLTEELAEIDKLIAAPKPESE